MRLGVSISLAGDEAAGGKDYVTGLGLAERTGFDSLWFFDSLGRGSFRPDPLSAMSAAAAVTERIEIGSCILQVPLRHPMELAHRILSAHFLSEGRLLLGVGAGSTETDFAAVEADFQSRFRTLVEALPIMQSLWRGETVRNVNLTPLPSARGGPPILIGSWAGSRWIPIAAKRYDGWIASAHFTNIATLKEGVARYRGEGGGRAIATNIPVDLTVDSTTLSDDDHFDLRCEPEEAAVRLAKLAEIGFDDAVVTVSTITEEHMAAVRALYP
ncbi:MAG: LLM class flavin-dependent oxidoreductase [Alphaproteobacteria bacterium]|nr:LLM class flavin-dependent oxidoreductase [Alphaproteobacteria bacterium]MBL6952460.1 LLM class flavin-dependent oxidoreductase [Alphaproteobacteria bacterium]